ncbi:hypothetical protein AVEN_254089-1 [Araneus ventricosus]|uniref:Uncharacterized protein n=1 Tax=Araneus ventricosus TaxID=182803 RepID=A0A4Y2BZ02_ARAVE|nr:hypothetical protein AVEN_254089-1 [Araneus ventricosus]
MFNEDSCIRFLCKRGTFQPPAIEIFPQNTVITVIHVSSRHQMELVESNFTKAGVLQRTGQLTTNWNSGNEFLSSFGGWMVKFQTLQEKEF